MTILAKVFKCRPWAIVILAVVCSMLTGCAGDEAGQLSRAAVSQIAQRPIDAYTWTFNDRPGALIQTDHYRLFTTLHRAGDRPLFACVLEAAYEQSELLNANTPVKQRMDCFVFDNRKEWERYTRARTGSNAPVYLQITAGGYCQSGVFAGYDIGREQTLSVIAHEAWHQYSWFSFKDRLPSWLEEGMATQNEQIIWEGTVPKFVPELNFRRFMALRAAVKGDYTWKLDELLTTHAGRVIAEPQRRIDAYYAQLWSLVLFLQHGNHKDGLTALLAAAREGRLAHELDGRGVTALQIANFTERWNKIAGPLYFSRYIGADRAAIEREYLTFVDALTAHWPPQIPTE